MNRLPDSTNGADELDTLPASFRWGVATSAYQIEGAVAADGRTPSIWDTFCRVPGAIDGGDTGDVACDHYHRMPADVALAAELGVDTYRFSVSWPRVQPGGRGQANAAGLDFYDRLVDRLREAGISPWLTLYHWDLPQQLQDAGGWPYRDTAYRFADYAGLVYERLGDRVDTWTTLNEPWCVAMLGHLEGVHAPGHRSLPEAVAATHHLLLAHGLAAQRIRASASGDPTVGITLNLTTADPATEAPEDVGAARRADGTGNRLFLDPLLRGEYPADVVTDLADRGGVLPIRDGDLGTISAPLDVLGVNYYFGLRYSGRDADGRTVDADGLPYGRVVDRDVPRTAMGWEIVPDRFEALLRRLGTDYPGVPLVVTENGAAFVDKPDATGQVEDPERIDYLAAHIRAVARARAAGTDIRGYFAWSLLDNFEWAYGYDKRFGLVAVDYPTQRRTVKRSGRWYRDLIARTRAR